MQFYIILHENASPAEQWFDRASMIEDRHHINVGAVNGIGNLKQDVMLAAVRRLSYSGRHGGYMLQYIDLYSGSTSMGPHAAILDLYSGSMGPHAAIYRLVFRVDGATCCNII